MRYLLLTGAMLLPSAVHARTEITPYVELRKVSQWTLPGKRLGIYAEPSAGISALFDTKRVDGSIGYQVFAPVAIKDEYDRGMRHTGSAAIAANLIRDYVNLGATANANLLNTGFSGLFNPDFDDPTRQQVYGASVQPAFGHVFANRISVNANYSYGLMEANSGNQPALVIGAPFDPARAGLTGASDSRSQAASASISNVGRSSRIRARATGSWQKDRTEQLDTHFDSARAIGDVEIVINRDFSLLGSGGYEDVKDEADNLLIDEVTGLPVPDAQGLIQADPRQPRITNFEYKGETYDAGFRFSPTRRFDLTARAGKRLGSFSAFGSLTYDVNSITSFLASYNEGIDNFGRLLTSLYIDPITGAVVPIATFAGGGRNVPVGTSRCAVGFDFDTGFCRFNITQIASSATFKNRTASISLQRGDAEFESDLPVYWNLSAFYSRRKFLGTQKSGLGVINPALTLAGTTDNSVGLRGQYQRLTSGTSFVVVDAAAQYNWLKLSRSVRDVYVSARARYEMLADRQINLFATGFVDRRFVLNGMSTIPGFPFFSQDTTRVTFSVGVRYLFRPHTGKFTPEKFAPDRASY